MPRNPTELRDRLAAFVEYRSRYLDGDEKSEAQIFLERLFQAFGHDGIAESGARLEERIRMIDRGGVSFADLRWSDRVIIEMKKAGTDLTRHYRQAFDYWVNAVPGRPRYVVLCNFDEFWIYDFDVQIDLPLDKVRTDDLVERHEALTFLLPEERAPIFGNDLEAVTRDAAARVSAVFRSLVDRGVDREFAQRFVLQGVVAMFAEDIGLLPGKFFTRALEEARTGEDAYDLLGGLFREMNTTGETRGGRFAGTPYFNGGLFTTVVPLELTDEELVLLREACVTNWSDVRPEIFGTIFEQSMDAGERHAYGAHFTSPADIAKVVLPTIVRPWTERIATSKSISDLEKVLLDMSTFRVLDPACGSGNFLYVAYREMRRLEHEVLAAIDDRRRSEGKRSQIAISYVTPDHFYGLDNNPFAVEVAKVTMMLAKKLAADELQDHQQDVLPLDNLDGTIREADALFTPWPKAHVIIGNPPYMGRRKMAEELGLDYIQRLAERYPGTHGVSDFVTYWFPLAHDALPRGGRAGFVATQAIRDNDSRAASLDYINRHDGAIFDATSSQPWSGDATVEVSIVNWIKEAENPPSERVLWLDKGQLRVVVDEIAPTLRLTTDVSGAKPLPANLNPKRQFQGQTTGRIPAYQLSYEDARRIIRADPGSRAVIFAVTGGRPMLTTIQPSHFVIDIAEDDLVEAEHKYPGAMSHLRAHALPYWQEQAAKEAAKNAELLERNPNGRPVLAKTQFLETKWWQHWRRRAEFVDAVSGIERYIGLSRVSTAGRKSVYSFISSDVRPDDSMALFALDDDYSFGVLSSSLHRAWFDERCSKMRVDPRYTPTTVWNSFPWPPNPTAEDVQTVSKIVAEIIALRSRYLSQGTTLARQYDVLRQPGRSKLGDLHEELDGAVIRAYGFDPREDLLEQALALNLAIASDSALGRRPGADGLQNAHATDYRLMGRPL